MTNPSRLLRSRATAALAVVALAATATGVLASAASASHFRASGPDFSITGDTATWVVTTAWESNDHDTFVGLGGTTDVLAISSYADAPGSGTSTGVTLEVVDVTETDEPLYAQVVETFQGDLSSLTDGLYEIYVDDCCRVSDIQNSATSDFSQWVRFSKVGTTYQVAPRLTAPVIYTPLKLDGTTTMVSYAAPGATTWSVVSDANDPYYGSNALPCSTFSGGALEVGAEHCGVGEVWTEIYVAGSFWAFKTEIVDAAGRQSVAETLFRVESIPAPYIDRHAWINGGASAQIWAYAEDVVVTSWAVTCTNIADPTDILTGTGTSMPITVNGFTAAETYDCIAAATNGAGTGTSAPGDYGDITAPDLALALDFGPGDLYAGNSALLEGSGLDPESAYTLTMYSDPIELYSGTTDPSGSFSNEVIIPEEACIPGEHELRLVGFSQDAEVSASQYVEIDENCYVVAVNRQQLAATGASPVAVGAGLVGLALALAGAALMALRGARRASTTTA